jgi:FkbM family methyltransferase
MTAGGPNSTTFRFPSKSNALHFLKQAGVEFGTIIDVGAHAETPELRLAFPDKKHVLFEPVEEFFPKIAANYAGMSCELVPVAVSDTNGTAKLQKIAISGDEISHSKIQSDVTVENLIDVPTVRLDTFFSGRTDPPPYLLKVDVDGYEIPILMGAEGIWDRIDCVIIEATADTFLERLQFVASKGYKLIDVVDQCYYSGVFSQADLIVVAERVLTRLPKLRPWETQDFHWRKWVPIASFEQFIPTKNAGNE